MHRLRMRPGLRAHVRSAMPGLRVIGMAYTGLIGFGAVVLVVSVAFVPVTPVLQPAQPAREVVGSLVQPATEAVADRAGFRRVPPETEPPVAPTAGLVVASGLPTHDALADSAAKPTDAIDVALALPFAPPLANEPALPPPTFVFVASPRVVPEAVPEETDAIVAEDVPVEEPSMPVIPLEPAPVQPVVVAEIQVQQAAQSEPPRPLPPTVRPTETARQAKAREDADNQAAIDAARATVVRLKAEADAANRAAIDARKAAVANVATPVPVEGARAAALRAKAEANAANQAAIDAARTPRPAATATLRSLPPTAPATPSPASAPTSEPGPTTSPTLAPVEPASVGVVDEQPLEQDEAPVMLAMDAPET